jgi:hypothetical protein
MNRILWMLLGWTLFLWMTAPAEILGGLAKDAVAGWSARPNWPAMVYIAVSLSVEITVWITLWWYYAKHTEKVGRGARFCLSHPWGVASGLLVLNLAHSSMEWELVKYLHNLAGIHFQNANPIDSWSFWSIAWNIASSEANGLLYLGAFSFLLWRYLRQAREAQLRFPPESQKEMPAHHEMRKIWNERWLFMAGGVVFLRFILMPGYEWLVVVAVAFMPLGGAFVVLAMVALQCAAFLGLGWMIWKHATQSSMVVRKWETRMLKWPATSAVCGLLIFMGAKAGFLMTGLVINKYHRVIQPAGWGFFSCYNYGLTFWISVVPVSLLLAFAYFHTKKKSDDPFLIN